MPWDKRFFIRTRRDIICELSIRGRCYACVQARVLVCCVLMKLSCESAQQPSPSLCLFVLHRCCKMQRYQLAELSVLSTASSPAFNINLKYFMFPNLRDFLMLSLCVREACGVVPKPSKIRVSTSAVSLHSPDSLAMQHHIPEPSVSANYLSGIEPEHGSISRKSCSPWSLATRITFVRKRTTKQ